MTRDPFLIEGPASISFSGGRTSAYMLWRILQAHGGTLPDDIKACFANTGKEMPQTLDFVRDCGEHWGVEVNWLEYRWQPGKVDFARVDHASASREGEPYDMLIEARSMLPNTVMRFCTEELKIKTMQRFHLSLGWKEWSSVVGLRADEPGRVAKMRMRNNEGKTDNGKDVLMPLANAGETKRDIEAFWRQQNFRLHLPMINGTSPYSNCDLCFLKSTSLIMNLLREQPDLAQWWIDKEANAQRTRKGKVRPEIANFRADRPSYARMLDTVQRQGNLDFGSDPDQRIDCFCSEDQ